MNIMFLGDVVGRAGRTVVFKHLNELQQQHNIDLTIINAENAAHGKGITRRIYQQFMEYDIDVLTMGNHTFSKGELLDFIKEAPCLIRPKNLLPLNLGQSVLVKTIKDKKIAIVNLCGEIFMDKIEGSPYNAMKEIIDEVQADAYIVDFHGETTSEKITFAHVFKEHCIAVCGTHTHVQTADERLIEGCAFISDLGMCGAYDSVLGRDKEEVIKHVVHKEKTRYTVAEGDAILCGAVIHVDDDTLKATSIQRIQIRP